MKPATRQATRHASSAPSARPSPNPKPKLKANGSDRTDRTDRTISASTADAESSYPLSEWMVKATDSHGHSAKVFTRVPPSYVHQIGAILQSKKFPWDTPADVVRVAIHRLCADVAKIMDDPDVTSQQAILNSMVELASRQMEYAHFADTLDKLDVAIKELLGRGAEPMARKIVRAVSEQIQKFDDDDWRGKYEVRLVKAHRGLLK